MKQRTEPTIWKTRYQKALNESSKKKREFKK